MSWSANCTRSDNDAPSCWGPGPPRWNTGIYSTTSAACRSDHREQAASLSVNCSFRCPIAIEVAMLGLAGLTMSLRVAGHTSTSMSSIGTAPSSTRSPSTSAPVKQARFSNLTDTGPTYGTKCLAPAAVVTFALIEFFQTKLQGDGASGCTDAKPRYLPSSSLSSAGRRSPADSRVRFQRSPKPMSSWAERNTLCRRTRRSTAAPGARSVPGGGVGVQRGSCHQGP